MSVGIAIGLIAVGLVTGAITSLVGASGVMIIVPALTMLFQVNTHMAIGTSLMVDVITSIVVAIGYFRAKNVKLTEALWLAASAILGAQLGARWAGTIPEGPLNIIFAVVMVISGLATLRSALKKTAETTETAETAEITETTESASTVKTSGTVETAGTTETSSNANGQKNDNENKKGKKGLRFSAPWQKTLALLVVGFGLGIISGLVGAGGGVMVLLALIFILQYPMHQAIGTSTVIMAITALSSAIGYGVQGRIDYTYGLLIAVGAVIAGIIGSRYANKINEKRLKIIVSIVFMVIGVVMLVLRFFA
jgi:uncharacterized membrane protein YfcA